MQLFVLPGISPVYPSCYQLWLIEQIYSILLTSLFCEPTACMTFHAWSLLETVCGGVESLVIVHAE